MTDAPRDSLELLDALLAIDVLRPGVIAWLRGQEEDLAAALGLVNGPAAWRRRRRRRLLAEIDRHLSGTPTTRAKQIEGLLSRAPGARSIEKSLPPSAIVALVAARELRIAVDHRTIRRDLKEGQDGSRFDLPNRCKVAAMEAREATAE